MTVKSSSFVLGAILAPMLAIGACGGSSPSSAPLSTGTTRSGNQTTPATTTPPSETTTPSQPTRSARSTSPSSNPPATEFNPPGDIPDNQVFVDYRVPGSGVHIKVPEGWARSSASGTTT